MSLKEMKILGVGIDEYEIVDAKARPVNSVAEMKAMLNLVAGNIIKTIGYYSANDGGGATYLIREKLETDVEDLGAIHFINDSLVAELISDKVVNVKQFGAKGDNITDDTQAIQNAINKFNKIHIQKGIYLISNTITIPQNKIITGDGAFNTQLNYNGLGNAVEIKYTAFGKLLIEDLSIYKGSKYDESDKTSIGIEVLYNTEKSRGVTNLEINRVVVRYFYINFRSSTPNALLNSCFNDCLFQNGYYNCYIIGGFANYFNRCQFTSGKNTGFYQKSGEANLLQCLIESNNIGVRLVNSGGKYNFDNCFFENVSKESGISLFSVTSDTNQEPINLINITNSHFYGGYEQLYVVQCKYLNAIGNTFRNTGNRCIAYPATDSNRIAFNLLGNTYDIIPNSAKNIYNMESINNDTGWVNVDTSDSVGTCSNIQVRKVGKIVRLRGTITGLTDENIGGTLLKLPEGFTPDVNLELLCSMHNGSGYKTTANVRVYTKSSGSIIQLRGYNAEGSTSNIISLDNLTFMTE